MEVWLYEVKTGPANNCCILNFLYALINQTRIFQSSIVFYRQANKILSKFQSGASYESGGHKIVVAIMKYIYPKIRKNINKILQMIIYSFYEWG